MTGSKETSVTVGPGFTTLLAVLFIALKLTGVIHWSWLWVLAPLWIPFAAFIVILVIVGIGVAVFKK